eukprot:CAMPEP_0184105536 /NCGR_PEP_ID=MMETSP0974-20121125/14922_1 /TAXON_ID=483370 /ORGANISM="non described non described, Strain CCMP2097" /LENGTH=196 /DNA_ID=CAMNT_0026408545 /DNA_START=65 /DNA_END=652 /DNA_ORIENTATION=+
MSLLRLLLHGDLHGLLDKMRQIRHALPALPHATVSFPRRVAETDAEARGQEQPKGDAISGEAYRDGKMSLKQSIPRAVELFRRGVVQGHAASQALMGDSYSTGLGVEVDHFTAAKWYKLSAAQGYPYAEYNLGQMAYFGNGVPQSYDDSVKWQRLAAAQGHPQALCNLGVSHMMGHGVKQDLHEALRLFKLAAAAG